MDVQFSIAPHVVEVFIVAVLLVWVAIIGSAVAGCILAYRAERRG